MANCNQKNENKSETKTISQKEEQLSQDEIDREVARVVDSAVNATSYQADAEVYGENPKVKKAKNILDEANGYVKKGIIKQMSTDEVNKKINPLMAKYEKILGELNPKEQEVVKNYRISELNKVVDLQVEASK